MQSSMQTNSFIPAVLCPNSTPSKTNSTYVLDAAIWFLDVLGIDSSNSYGLQGEKVKVSSSSVAEYVVVTVSSLLRSQPGFESNNLGFSKALKTKLLYSDRLFARVTAVHVLRR